MRTGDDDQSAKNDNPIKYGEIVADRHRAAVRRSTGESTSAPQLKTL
jgi:hypothetical protein